MNLKIAVLGSGAREHALLTALHRSQLRFHPDQDIQLHCLGTTHNPAIRALCAGSGGILTVGDITDTAFVAKQCRDLRADLVIIGPEAPLESGVADILRRHGTAVLGPGKTLARIETSKSFARTFLTSTLPQACPSFTIASTLAQAADFLSTLGQHYVIKADGLTGGKGVKVAQDHLHNHREALDYCDQLLAAEGARCVIEEKLYGEEFSLMTLTDGATCIHFPAVQDHKRAYDGDTGPNTGGMGSYTCPDHNLPFLSIEDIATARQYNETVAAVLSKQCGEPYRGILYGGFMAVEKGVRIIEYNARFGDPEALNLLSLLESDAIELFLRAANGTLAGCQASFASQASVCKYVVPAGYPQKVEKGIPLALGTLQPPAYLYLGSVDASPEAGLVTAGSRTYAVVALADTLAEAEKLSEKHIQRLVDSDERLRHRSDIGTTALIQRRINHMDVLRRPVRLGILGSTRGTDLQHLIDAIANQTLAAEIALVVSDRKEAGILSRASSHGIQTLYAHCRPHQREQQEQQISSAFAQAGVDLILLIGYMRILSPWFCNTWENRLLNIHPSLLPDFAGGMDTDVHAAVISRMKTDGHAWTGCTVHKATQEVDQGAIIVQKRCRVLPDDTPETLKQRVQQLEGIALIEVVSYYHRTAGTDPSWRGMA